MYENMSISTIHIQITVKAEENMRFPDLDLQMVVTCHVCASDFESVQKHPEF